MAKKDTNENVKFYRIAIADPAYEFVSSIPADKRLLLQSYMQGVLGHRLTMLHHQLDQEAANDHG